MGLNRAFTQDLQLIVSGGQTQVMRGIAKVIQKLNQLIERGTDFELVIQERLVVGPLGLDVQKMLSRFNGRLVLVVTDVSDV